MALHRAIDERRRAQDLTWSQVVREMGAQSAELNARRHDHPISPATFSGMATRRATSCQHALFALRWLDVAPEAFLAGTAGALPGMPDTQAAETAQALPMAGPDRRLRWDLPALARAIDDERRERGLTWAEVAAEVGCTPSQASGLRNVRYAVGMDLAMRLVQWLDRPAADFIHAARW